MKQRYSDAFLDALLAKPASAEWSKEERAALPDAMRRLDDVRETERCTHADLVRMQEGGGAVLATPTDHYKFRSFGLPKNYVYHREAGGTFAPDGSCQFENREQVERTVKRANAAGEGILYDGRTRTYYPE